MTMQPFDFHAGAAERQAAALPGDRLPVIETAARVGIGYAPEPWRSLPWRFVDITSPSVAPLRHATAPA